MAGKGWTLYGPDKKVYQEITKAMNGEKYVTIDFNVHDRETLVIAYALAKIQKMNYGLWKKIYMLCVEEIFQSSGCIVPPNWTGVTKKFSNRLTPIIGGKKYTCINDDRYETERNYPACKLDTEYDSAIFLSELGKFFFVSYKTEMRYPTRAPFIKYEEEYELEKVYYLKSDNLKGNICVAHHINLRNLRKNSEPLGVEIVSPWDSTKKTNSNHQKHLVIVCPNPY